MTDQKYVDTLEQEDRVLALTMRVNKCLPPEITYYKTIIRALNIAQRRPSGTFTKTGGKFFNCGKMRDEIKRLLTIKPIDLEPLHTCDQCQLLITPDDQARSKCGMIYIHTDCDPAWEEAHGKPFPWECDDSDEEDEEDESDAEPEPVKPHVKLWTAPWDTKMWRLAQGDDWHSDNHCWAFNKKELFNFNTTPYIGKYNEAEQECDEGSRPRNPEWKFISASS